MTESYQQRLKKGVSTKSITAMIVFGAIILVFVFFGFSGRLGGGGIGAAAQVNNSLISVSNLQTAEANLKQVYGEVFGNDANRLRSEALRGLVDRELMSQAARKNGIVVSDQEVREAITKEVPVFQAGGRFQRDYYNRYLEMTHQLPRDFENSIRQQQEAMRVRHLFDVASKVTTLESEKLSALKAYKLNVQFVHFDNATLAKNFAVSNEEAEKSLANAEFLKKVQETFEKNKSDYAQEEQVRAQHILLPLKEGASESEAKAVLDKAEDLLKKAATTDFGKLAAKYSEDPGSKSKNGDLGYFGRGKMIKEFDEAAFSTPVGKIAGPVKTAYGYHLIKVNDKKAAEPANFDKQKLSIAKQVLAEEKLAAQVKTLEEAVSKNDEPALENGLKAVNAKWEETGEFALGDEAIPKINSLVASNAIGELQEDQKLLKRILRDGEEKYILKLKESRFAALEPVPAMTKTMTEATRANMLFGAWLNDFKKDSKVVINNALMTAQP
jgi:peptidyl-prolyl cis-trans isomerase D